ncbi:MAG: hypothetical protein KME21_10395 [Desmonostoc vinosum HA7617-LM4]|jgi:hypothetical protein|nr:hypothetical protein [Desmonostoc vinosum HA7617-LM4]
MLIEVAEGIFSVELPDATFLLLFATAVGSKIVNSTEFFKQPECIARKVQSAHKRGEIRC